MESSTKRKLSLASKAIIVLMYLLSAIGSNFLLSSTDVDMDIIYLGVILLVIGITEWILYLSTEKRTLDFCHDVVIAAFEVAFGLMFIVQNGPLHMSSCCLMWGTIEVIKSLFELYEIFMERHHKSKFELALDTILTVATLVFGVLLCIHLDNGLRLHLIVTTASLFANSLVYAFRFFVYPRRKKEHDKEECHN